MIKRLLLPASIVIFGFVVLFVSITNASEISFNVADLNQPLPEGPILSKQYFVNYEMPEASSSPIPIFSRLHAVGDKLQILTAMSAHQKSQIMLDNANRRMVMGEKLIRQGKIDEGLVVINKAQVYLGKSYESATQSESYRANLLMREISIASLKHRERMENLMAIMPDQSRPMIVHSLDASKFIYNQTKTMLLSFGETPPPSPFEK